MFEWVVFNIIIPFGIGLAAGMLGVSFYNLMKGDR